MSLISQNAIPKEAGKKKKTAPKKDEIDRVDEREEELVEGDKIRVDEREEELVEGDKIIVYATKNKKRKKGRKENDELLEIEEGKQMKKLESFLFGSLHSPVEFGKDEEEEATEEVDNSSALFFTDRSANNSLSVYEEDMDTRVESSELQVNNERKPVWVDDEEEKISINIAQVNKLRKLRKEEDESVVSAATYTSRLRAQHMKMNRGTDWARPNSQLMYSSEDDDSDKESGVVVASGYDHVEYADDILRTDEDLVLKRSAKLLPGLLEYSRLLDANMKDPGHGPINSVQFHKNAQLLLVGGLDKTLKFFQVDGKKNEMIQSIFLEDCPIRKAAFLPDGSKAIISGRRKFAYCFDLVKATVDKIGPLVGRDEKSMESFEVSPDSKTIAFLGNEGHILLVSSKTKELIGTLKMNGTVRSIAFSNDGQQLLSSGGDGQIYHWDLRTRSCLHKGTDEGCLTGTALSVSPVGNLFAAGSDSGIVNIYNRDDFIGGKRKPLKVVDNLTTKVDFMRFNPDAQILAISSRMKKNSMKLIHVPSLTVFSNWPPPNQAVVHYPSCTDFSPHGGLMAVGNAAGKVLLYKLHHYHQA